MLDKPHVSTKITAHTCEAIWRKSRLRHGGRHCSHWDRRSACSFLQRWRHKSTPTQAGQGEAMRIDRWPSEREGRRRSGDSNFAELGSVTAVWIVQDSGTATLSGTTGVRINADRGRRSPSGSRLGRGNELRGMKGRRQHAETKHERRNSAETCVNVSRSESASRRPAE